MPPPPPPPRFASAVAVAVAVAVAAAIWPTSAVHISVGRRSPLAWPPPSLPPLLPSRTAVSSTRRPRTTRRRTKSDGREEVRTDGRDSRRDETLFNIIRTRYPFFSSLPRGRIICFQPDTHRRRHLESVTETTMHAQNASHHELGRPRARTQIGPHYRELKNVNEVTTLFKGRFAKFNPFIRDSSLLA